MECLSIKQFKFVDCQALKYNEVCEKQTACKNELKYKCSSLYCSENKEICDYPFNIHVISTSEGK